MGALASSTDVDGLNVFVDATLSALIAGAIGALALVCTLVCVVVLVVLQGRNRRRNMGRAAAIAHWRPWLTRAMAGALAPDEIHALGLIKNAELSALMILWNQYQDTLRGAVIVALNDAAAKLGLREHALRMTRARDPADRLIGLMTLAHLAVDSDWNLVAPFLDDRDPYLSLAAGRVTVKLDAATAVPLLLQTYLGRHDWPEPSVVALLVHVDADWLGRCIDRLACQVRPDEQLRLLALMRGCVGSTVQGTLDFLLQTAVDPGVLAAALAQTTSLSSHDRVCVLAAHEDAQVRAYAACALGRFVRLNPPALAQPAATPLLAGADQADTEGGHAAQAVPHSVPQPVPRQVRRLSSRRVTPSKSGAFVRVGGDRRVARGRLRPGLGHPPPPSVTSLPMSLLERYASTASEEWLLLHLMHDPAWVVREQAARALVGAPGASEQHMHAWLMRLDIDDSRAILRQAWADVMYDQGKPMVLAAPHVMQASVA